MIRYVCYFFIKTLCVIHLYMYMRVIYASVFYYTSPRFPMVYYTKLQGHVRNMLAYEHSTRHRKLRSSNSLGQAILRVYHAKPMAYCEPRRDATRRDVKYQEILKEFQGVSLSFIYCISPSTFSQYQ